MRRFSGSRPDCGPQRRLPRREGIALLVTMIVFVVLYLIVFHLRYFTRVEERIAQVRYGEIQSQDALYSVASYALTLLVEDLKQDFQEMSDGAQGGGAAAPLGASGPGGGPPTAGPGGAGAPGGAAPGGAAPGGVAPGGVAPGVPAGGGAGGGGTATHYDYIRESLFNDNVQSFGEVKVKVTFVDNERKFCLNLIFQYAPQKDGDDQAALAELGLDAEALEAAGNAESTEAGAQSLRERLLANTNLRNMGNRGRNGADPDDPDAPADPDDPDALAEELPPGLEWEADLTEFTEPTDARIRATEEMLARAIEVVISINETNDFRYAGHYNSEEIAAEIVRFVLDVRRAPTQNVIYDAAELLNLDRITPELYYGPSLSIPKGEVFTTVDGFALSRDEFGDIVYEYQDPFYMEEMAYQREELAALQEQFGSFMDFPGLLGGSLGESALTRGMTEPPQIEDEEGNVSVLEPHLPLGLKDIFCAFSSGKININTAPVPVLYALLPSLEEGNEGEAETVALQIDEYRNRMQEYAEDPEGEEGVERASDNQTPDLGQPRRPVPTEEELGEEGVEVSDLASWQGGAASLNDLETNYFTNLRQIELIDGTDGGPEDLLTSSTGVDRVSAEDDPLLQRVINDYSQVMVFGSTYFTVELKAKFENSPMVKTGHLIVKRDATQRVLDVILWKELQK